MSTERKYRPTLLQGIRMGWWFASGRCMGCGSDGCQVCDRCFYREKHVSMNDEGLNCHRTFAGQRTFVYCPHCQFELVAGGKLIYDNERGVYYRCRNCHRASLWNFDFPVPMLAADLQVSIPRFEDKTDGN